MPPEKHGGDVRVQDQNLVLLTCNLDPSLVGGAILPALGDVPDVGSIAKPAAFRPPYDEVQRVPAFSFFNLVAASSQCLLDEPDEILLPDVHVTVCL